jgi:hypothetical protein
VAAESESESVLSQSAASASVPVPVLSQSAVQSRWGARAVAWVSGLAAVALLLSGVFKPADVTRSERLAGWLNAHGLHYGLSGYWDGTSTTADSGNAVGVRAVLDMGDHYAIYPWVTNGPWYDPAKYNATFFIADDATPGVTVADVEKVYGKPDATYSVALREILVYHVNLLSTVSVPAHPDF